MIDHVKESPRFIYGTAWKEDKTQTLTTMAIQHGFRAIDTANQRKHYHEAGVGEGVATAIRDGVTTRDQLFLQTKFIFQRGQDHRLPYDPNAPIGDQVRQSFESSLDHLQTDYLDSYVLHGPSSGIGLKAPDWAAWRGMEAIYADGRTHRLGISNISLEQLKILCDGAKVVPTFVQNRCYANKGWDQQVRRFCRTHGILYQGFSLLTANRDVFGHSALIAIAKRHKSPPTRVVFRFAQERSMIPLTGTSNTDHMDSDLDATNMSLNQEELDVIENLLITE